MRLPSNRLTNVNTATYTPNCLKNCWLPVPILIGVCLFLCPAKVSAQFSDWQNPNGGNFNDPTNWNDGVPDAGQTSVARFTNNAQVSSTSGPVYFTTNTMLGGVQNFYAVDFDLRGFQVTIFDQTTEGQFGAPVSFRSSGPNRGQLIFDQDLFLTGDAIEPGRFTIGSGVDAIVDGNVSDGDDMQDSLFKLEVVDGGTMQIFGDLNLADDDLSPNAPNLSTVRVTGAGSLLHVEGSLLDFDNQAFQGSFTYPPNYRITVEDQGILRVNGAFGSETGVDAALTSVQMSNGILDINDPSGAKGDIRGFGTVVHNSSVNFAGKSINNPEGQVSFDNDVVLGTGNDVVTFFSSGAVRVEDDTTLQITNGRSTSGFFVGDNALLKADSITGGSVQLQNGLLAVNQQNTPVFGYGVVQNNNTVINHPTGIVDLNRDLEVSGQNQTTIYSTATARLGPTTTLNLGTLNSEHGVQFDSGDVLQGRGVVNGAFTGLVNSKLLANSGTLTIGNANDFNGFQTDGLVDIDSGSELVIESGARSRLGGSTVVDGQLTAQKGIAISDGAVLTGSGTVTGSVVGSAGSSIIATGNLSLGDSRTFDGYSVSGTLDVGNHSVTIRDKNVADLGLITKIGTQSSAGTLIVPQGAVIDFGENVVGFGVISSINDEASPLINNGLIQGDSSSNPITATGYIKGVGDFVNFNPTGTFSPGLSPAAVDVTNLTLSQESRLVMEIGGLSPGSLHDILLVHGFAELAGTLEVDLLYGFNPQLGDSFTLLSGDEILGDFNLFDLPNLDLGLRWDVSRGHGFYNLYVAAVPEPTVFSLLAAPVFLALIRRGRRSR